MKNPTVKGHSLRIVRRSLYGNLCECECECGFQVQLWFDRLSVARRKHLQHLKNVLASRRQGSLG